MGAEIRTASLETGAPKERGCGSGVGTGWKAIVDRTIIASKCESHGESNFSLQ